MPAEGVENKDHQDILSYEEILKIVETGIKLGIKKVRITGGEPLVRLGVEDFISDLNRLQLDDISMT
jgi:cyclic pyranopterin phosphate synthase